MMKKTLLLSHIDVKDGYIINFPISNIEKIIWI